MFHVERIRLLIVLAPDSGHRLIARLTHVKPAGHQRAQHGEEVGDDTKHEHDDDARREQARHQAILERSTPATDPEA